MTPSSNRALRVGVIGLGGMGSFHARTLQALPGVDVVALADPFGESVVELGAELDAEVGRDALALAARPDLDGLVIASPDDTHAELTLTALAENTMVLCEKPLATSLADCHRVMDAEVAHEQRLIQLGFMREYDQAHLQLQQALSDLGPLHHLRSVHRNTNAEARPPDSVLGQSAVHDFHTVRWLTGSEVLAVTAFAVDRPGGLHHVLAVCELEPAPSMAPGMVATVEFIDNGYAYEVLVEATAAGGGVRTGTPTRALSMIDGDAAIAVGDDWFGRFADAYRAEAVAWVESVRAGVAIGPSVWDGLVAQAIVEAAGQSIRAGGRVVAERPPMPELYAS